MKKKTENKKNDADISIAASGNVHNKNEFPVLNATTSVASRKSGDLFCMRRPSGRGISKLRIMHSFYLTSVR